VAVLKGVIDQDVAKKTAAQKQAAEDSPEVMAARSQKFTEFQNHAMKLWGYSSRTFPYSIPVDSRGQDILVTGDKATQTQLNGLAKDLMDWAAGHMMDPSFPGADPKRCWSIF
jgi:hypothetical protein